MRSLAIRAFTKYASGFELLDIPIPEISSPDDILVKVYAAALNPADLAFAGGMTKLLETMHFPYSVGLDFAGVVHEIGSSVTHLQVGDRVFGMSMGGGSLSEFILLTPKSIHRHGIAKIPSGLTFTDAASLPSVALTASTACSRAEAEIPGGLKGKTVFIPGGLSGTGSMGVQIAKHVFGAAKVITTVSTAKVARVAELTGRDTVDQIVDYTKGDVNRIIGSGTVDFVFDTMNMRMPFLPLLKPNTGFLCSIATPPSGRKVKHDFPKAPWAVTGLLNTIDKLYTWRASRWHVKYESIHVIPNSEDFEQLAEWVEDGKVRAVVGRTTDLADIEGIREGIQDIQAHRGTIGKFVVVVIDK